MKTVYLKQPSRDFYPREGISMSAIPIAVIEANADDARIAAAEAKILPLVDEAGAVLLRGFDFDLDILEKFTHIFCENFHIPATRYARRKSTGDHHTTEVFGNNYSLLGHTEGTYKAYPAAPEMCFFMCVTPPAELGGETTLIDGMEFYRCIPEALRLRFEEQGITYEMTWERERWQNEFGIELIEELEALLSGIKGTRYSMNGDELHLFYSTQAITRSRRGDLVFANAMLAHLPHITHSQYVGQNAYCKPSNRVYWGNGDVIADEVLNTLIDIHDSIAYPHRWQANDVLVIDNTRYLHGRTMTLRDCDRVLISRFGWLKKAL
jgi:alpha-ketoglutarate-dependent taurine dioxygenase